MVWPVMKAGRSSLARKAHRAHQVFGPFIALDRTRHFGDLPLIEMGRGLHHSLEGV